MAAGLGYKEFATGDVLTATDANGYLASQVVMVFASSAARSSAITSPQEGMFSYLKDTNATQYYDGSAWSTVGGSTTPSFALINTGGTALSGSSTVTVSGISNKNDLYIFASGVTGGDGNSYGTITLRFNTDSGSNYEYVASYDMIQSTGTNPFVGLNSKSASATSIAINGDKMPVTLAIRVSGASGSGVKPVIYNCIGTVGNDYMSRTTGQGSYKGTSAISSVSFICSGNFTAGTVYVYGA